MLREGGEVVGDSRRLNEEQHEQVRRVWQMWQEMCSDEKRRRIQSLSESLGVSEDDVENLWHRFC